MNTILSYHQEGDSQDRMEPDIFLTPDELDDDVFYPDEFDFSRGPLTSSSSLFAQSPPYNSLLGRFHLFSVSHCCGPGCRITECKDKATQTLEPSPLNGDIMLPCGVSESPQRLFYGNAGYLLHQSTNLTMRFGNRTGHPRQEQSSDRRIARKLQCIGDQFHRIHLQRELKNGKRVCLIPRDHIDSNGVCRVFIMPDEKAGLALLYHPGFLMDSAPEEPIRDSDTDLQQNRNHIWFQILVFFRNLVIHRERNRFHFQR